MQQAAFFHFKAQPGIKNAGNDKSYGNKQDDGKRAKPRVK